MDERKVRRMINAIKILCNQMELLAEDSKKESLLGAFKLSQNSQAMAELNKELLKYGCFGFILFCFGSYFIKSFVVFICRIKQQGGKKYNQ